MRSTQIFVHKRYACISLIYTTYSKNVSERFSSAVFLDSSLFAGYCAEIWFSPSPFELRNDDDAVVLLREKYFLLLKFLYKRGRKN